MGCGSCCAQFILVFFNTIFILLGLLFIAIGTLAKLGSSLVTQGADTILKAIPGIPTALGINATDIKQNENIKTVLDISDALNAVAIALIVVGAFIFLMGCFGCCGACCKFVPLLIIYIVIVAILALAQAALVGLLFSGKFDSDFQRVVNVTLVRFKGIDETDVNSAVWNIGQINFGCCGITNYTNFDHAKDWKRVRTFENKKQTLTTPIACCKFNGTWPNAKPVSKDCASKPTPQNSNYDMPCWNKVIMLLEKYRWPVIGGCCGIIGVQVLMIIFAIWVIQDKRSQDK